MSRPAIVKFFWRCVAGNIYLARQIVQDGLAIDTQNVAVVDADFMSSFEHYLVQGGEVDASHVREK